MKKLFLFTALFVAAAFSACSKHDNEINGVEPPVPPEPQPLVIAFAEGNFLQFDVNETKTVNYTITGGSGNTVIKAELQNPDGAYTVKTTPISATEGTIAITAQMPIDNYVIVTVSDGNRLITAEIAVSTNPIPEKEKLAITFAEGNSLQFDVNETKIVHYTITGGSNKTVVKAEMPNIDGAYALSTTSTSATEGTIKITAKVPTDNCVIVTVSDGSQIITATIDVTLKVSFDGKAVVVAIPGTLAALLAGYDTTEITELTVIGNLNAEDIATLKNLPYLAVLDMENVNLEELPANAFREKQSLTSVKLPKTLKIIGGQAFASCYNLTSITIPDSVTEIGDWAFYYCSSLTSITIPDGVTSIGEFAFHFCDSLTSVTIPDSVTTIGKQAFFGCSSLTSITIPDSVTTIGDSAFYGCHSLTSVTIGNGVKSIGISAFVHCHSLTSITIPDSVTMIGSGAFEGCSNLSAFYGKLASSDNRCLIVDGCLTAFAPAGLTFYTIPNSITSIGICAFSQCSGLTRITIGNNVKSIGNGAFYLCSNLIYIKCRAQTPPSVGINAFSNVNASATLYVPTGSKAAYAAAYGWNEFKTIIETQF
ncbi:MAG: leucine-rich repeat domain-containing protein [Alistipes sp.]|nr:leucine-rich repeat domain-containing protein [Alistipes sp.]